MKIYLLSMLVLAGFWFSSNFDKKQHPLANKQPPLKMGIFPRFPPAITTDRYKPLEKYLSFELGRRVSLEVSNDFPEFWQKVRTGQFDIVHFNQYHYIRSHKEQGYEVIAQNMEQGKKTLAPAIVVRKDSGIRTLEDLRGKKILFGGGKKAMIAYIYVTYMLRQAGLQKGDYIEQFEVNPPAAVVATYYGLWDSAAAGAGDIVLGLPLMKKQIRPDHMRYLAIGEQFAHIPWAVSKKLSPELKFNIQNALIGLGKRPEGRKILKKARLNKFVMARDDDFNPYRKITKLVTGEHY